jgi:adenosine deaminase
MAQPQAATQNGETRAARALEHARQQGPLALYAFFHDMPKGADLHTHLAGAVYAESFIREAAEDNLCINSKTLVLYKTMEMTRSLRSYQPEALRPADQHIFHANVRPYHRGVGTRSLFRIVRPLSSS